MKLLCRRHLELALDVDGLKKWLLGVPRTWTLWFQDRLSTFGASDPLRAITANFRKFCEGFWTYDLLRSALRLLFAVYCPARP